MWIYVEPDMLGKYHAMKVTREEYEVLCLLQYFKNEGGVFFSSSDTNVSRKEIRTVVRNYRAQTRKGKHNAKAKQNTAR